MYKYQEDLNFHKQNPDPVICTTKEDLYYLGQFRYGTYLPIHKQDLWTYRSYYKALSFKYLSMSYKSKDYPFKEQSLYTNRERER
jgi:hypothetical protein